MALIECKECGKEISDKAATCPHCGCPVLSGIGQLVIYGYRETYSVNVDIKVYKDGEFIGRIGNNGVMQIEIENDCLIEFKAMFRSVKYEAKAEGLQKVLLSWDRVSGKLKVNKVDNIY